MQHFSLDGPVFAIVTPFQPGTPPTLDDDAYVKYLQVKVVLVLASTTPVSRPVKSLCGLTLAHKR